MRSRWPLVVVAGTAASLLAPAEVGAVVWTRAGADAPTREAPRAAPTGAVTDRVSVSSDAVQGDAASIDVAVSGNGRYAAFTSEAGNLVPGDTNGLADVFVRDRWSGTTERVAVAADGSESDEGATEPALSRDGRYVAFTSWAASLVPGDTNQRSDIFVRDRWAGTTTRVSVASTGAEADNMSYAPAISADGRYVAFLSEARNLVGTDANGRSPDVFVHDRRRGTTVLVSASLAGTGGNGYNESVSISGDGRYVAFMSFSTDLVADGQEEPGLFVRDLRSGVTTRAALTRAGAPVTGLGAGVISGNGRYVAFSADAPDVVPDDTNELTDIFVRDRWTGRTERVSLTTGAAQANDANMLPVISDDGRCVAFQSFASNLVPDDGTGLLDVFVRDRVSRTTSRVSVSTTGGDADNYSAGAAISGDGRYVGFVSYASDLVPGDTNGHYDAFVRGGQCGG